MNLPSGSQDNARTKRKVEIDDGEDDKGDLDQILRALMFQKTEFAQFAERQELLVNEIMCKLTSDHSANDTDATGVNSVAVGAVPLPSCHASEKTILSESGGQYALPDHPSKFEGQSTLGITKTGRSNQSAVRISKKAEQLNQDIDETVAVHKSIASRGFCIRFVGSPAFELCTGAAVVLHIIVMGINFQVRSYELQDVLDGRRDGAIEDHAVFDILEKGFNLLYLFELCARLRCFGCDYFRQSPLINIADTVIVLLCCFASFILKPMDINLRGGTIALARVVRMARILKVVRAFRVFNVLTMFTELRVLIRTLMTAFSRTLLWASIMIAFTVFVASILMCTLTTTLIEEKNMSLAKRQYLFDNYGSTGRASYTLFEDTFTGRWGIRARKLIFEYNSAVFSIVYAFYVLVVNFAMIRVIAAIFLKQTMDNLHLDAEKQAMQQSQELKIKTQMLRKMYELVDNDGDGLIELEELEEMSQNPKVREIFNRLDIGEDEVYALFDIISDNGSAVSFEELLKGVEKLKGHVNEADVIQLQHELIKAVAGIQDIQRMLALHWEHMSHGKFLAHGFTNNVHTTKTRHDRTELATTCTI